jgi:hypothetical protein
MEPDPERSEGFRRNEESHVPVTECQRGTGNEESHVTLPEGQRGIWNEESHVPVAECHRGMGKGARGMRNLIFP